MADRGEITMRACPNGPLLVRGSFSLVQEDGTEVTLRRRTNALCRCGASALLPLCDGSHRSLAQQTWESRPAPN